MKLLFAGKSSSVNIQTVLENKCQCGIGIELKSKTDRNGEKCRTPTGVDVIRGKGV